MRESLGATKPKGEMKVKVLPRELRCDPACPAQHRPVSRASSLRRRKSVHVRTRKMVTYA